MKTKKILSLLLISVFGIVSVILPVLFLPDLDRIESPLFPMLGTGLKSISVWSFGFLFLSGLIGRLVINLPGWKIGLLTIVLFPLASICEIMVDPTSHNLLPVELFLYASYSIPAMLGAYVIQGIESFDPNKTNNK
jgi:hypothetical protein